MRIKDLGDVFPQNRVLADSYLMDDDTTEAIQKAYDNIRLISKEAQARADLTTSHLAYVTRERQKIEALKVKTMAELVEDAVNNGASVAVFVNYLDTMALLKEQLGINCVYLRGGRAHV